MSFKQALIQRAASLGFGRAIVSEARPYSVWRADTEARPDPRWTRLAFDPESILPGARRVVVLVWPYTPYRAEPNEPAIDAYYVASNASHQAAQALGEWLAGQGVRAVTRPKLPHKAAAASCALARYGRNGLSYIDGLGSRYALELIITDAQLMPDELALAASQRGAHGTCSACGAYDASGACVRMCPTGALFGDWRVDTARCLRALPAGAPVPELYRTLIANSLIGCDICQRVCPKNANIGEVETPADVRRALDLTKLLAGDTTALVPLIGANYARMKQTQARACLIAANLNRADLLPQIGRLAADEHEAVREHARWALRRLSKP